MITTEIKRGEFNAYYPISNLKMASINRDIFKPHAENFKLKLNNYGWMMPIVISLKGDVIEGHHRIISAILLKQKTIPVYIIDWVDTNIEKEHLNCIINLNNGNRAWNKLDYLKAYITTNEDYKKVYNSFLINKNTLSVGNVINAYFYENKSNFNKGLCKIKNEDFAIYLINNFSKLINKHTRRKIQSYCVRELINIAYVKTNMSKDVMNYIFNYYDKMAKTNHLSLTSISDFKPHMELILNDYKKTK